MPRSARISATASGCVMYGSPLLRVWPRCICSAIAYARRSRLGSPLGWLDRCVRTRLSTGSSAVGQGSFDGNSARSRRVMLAGGDEAGLAGGAEKAGSTGTAGLADFERRAGLVDVPGSALVDLVFASAVLAAGAFFG